MQASSNSAKNFPACFTRRLFVPSLLNLFHRCCPCF